MLFLTVDGCEPVFPFIIVARKSGRVSAELQMCRASQLCCTVSHSLEKGSSYLEHEERELEAHTVLADGIPFLYSENQHIGYRSDSLVFSVRRLLDSKTWKH